MPSVIERNGKRLLQWRMPGSPKRFWAGLGSTQAKAAEMIRVRLGDVLSELKAYGKLSPQSSGWVATLGRSLKQKFAECGLIEAEKTVMQLCSEFEEKTKRKDATNVAYGHTINNLCKCYGATTPASKVDGRLFRPFLETQGLSRATINRRIGVARSIFKPLKDANPFTGTVGGSQRNSTRKHYVTAATAKMIASHADPELAAAIMLARFAGLRIPSEIAGMRQAHVMWDRNRLFVLSPKTEHHEGGASREVPLFPELHETLLTLCERSTSGLLFPAQAEVSNVALRRRFYRLLTRLGIAAWPRLFQNLRASWTTDVLRKYSAADESKWGGHRPDTAMEHYDMNTDEAFRTASQSPLAQPSTGVTYGPRPSSTTTGSVSAGVQTVNSDGKMGAIGRGQPRQTRQKVNLVAARAAIAAKRQRLLARAARRHSGRGEQRG